MLCDSCAHFYVTHEITLRPVAESAFIATNSSGPLQHKANIVSSLLLDAVDVAESSNRSTVSMEVDCSSLYGELAVMATGKSCRMSCSSPIRQLITIATVREQCLAAYCSHAIP